MARYSEHDTNNIYEAAKAFRERCLLHDGSLLFEGAALWHPELLAQIHKAFVDTPDEGDRSLPHNSVDAVQKVKGLFAKMQGTEPRWRAQA